MCYPSISALAYSDRDAWINVFPFEQEAARGRQSLTHPAEGESGEGSNVKLEGG